MLRIAVFLLAAWPVLAAAHDWERLDAGRIVDALSDGEVVIAGVSQRFSASGATVLDVSPPRSGRWRVRGNLFCVQMPPARGWACYAIDVGHDSQIRFVSTSGQVVLGTLTP